jgi:microcystin-dependent protein
VYRLIAIPLPFEAHVRGALGILANPNNWEEQGDMTPLECADALAPLQDWSNLLIGTIHEYATSDLPDGVLPCDGTTYNRVDYPNLYAVIDAAFIVDEDTFITPNRAGRSPMGEDGTHVLGDVGGSETHTQTVDELVPHTHTIQQGFGPSVALSVVLGAIEGLDAIPTEEITSETGSGEAFSILHPVAYTRYGIIAR